MTLRECVEAESPSVPPTSGTRMSDVERALWLADKLVGDYGSEAAQLLRKFASSASGKQDCVWKRDDDGIYQTGCGNTWMFTDGDYITDHKAKFCPYCAGSIKDESDALA